MSVLGLDLSLRNCGLAVWDGGRQVLATVYRPRLKTAVQRRAEIRSVVEKIVARTDWGVDCIVFEDVAAWLHSRIPPRAVQAPMSLGTTIEDWAFGRVEVMVVGVNTWKKVVLGNGRAGKEESVRYVRRRFGRALNHNAADAVCLAVYGWGMRYPEVGRAAVRVAP